MIENIHLCKNEIDGGEQIKTKVDEFPMDSFTFVFLLLKNEHVMVEKLLKFFICYVDAKLLKRVERKNLESCNVEHTNEECTSVFS